MESLPDCWPLAGMSLPGTHNSATWDRSSLCTALAIKHCCLCQNKYINEQLEAGIRVFDIRPSFNNHEHLYLWHDSIKLGGITLSDVLGIFTDYLLKYPSETVLLMFKCHWERKYCGEEFVALFKAKVILFNYIWPNLFYSSPFDNPDDDKFKKSPLLGEVRGKIVFANQMYNDPVQTCIPSLVNFEGAKIENNWKFEEENEYLAELFSHIAKAKLNLTEPKCGDGRFWVTWLSANNCHRLGWGPRAIADRVNLFFRRKLIQYRQSIYRTSGIIMMDFPPKNLINHIIAENYDIMLRNNKLGIENCKCLDVVSGPPIC